MPGHGQNAGDRGRRDELFAARPPIVSETGALAVARAFGITGEIRRLDGERDQNFLVRENPARAWVIKIPHPAEDVQALELRLAAFEHCAHRAPTLGLPRLRRTLDGACVHEFLDAQGQSRRAYVVRYIEGKLFHESAPRQDLLRALGATVARLDVALADFRHPPSGQILLWDLTQAGAAKDLLSFVHDAGLRARAEHALARFGAEIGPKLVRFRRQFVHNDVNPHNVVVTANGASVAGIIDFGDLVHAPLVNEVAIAATYQVTGEDPIGNALTLVRGYHAVVPLLPEEIELLPALMATRMAVAVAVSCWRARLSPAQRAYILRNIPVAAAGLAILESAGDLPRRFAIALA